MSKPIDSKLYRAVKSSIKKAKITNKTVVVRPATSILEAVKQEPIVKKKK